jgi:hypothetical protein
MAFKSGFDKTALGVGKTVAGYGARAFKSIAKNPLKSMAAAGAGAVGASKLLGSGGGDNSQQG